MDEPVRGTQSIVAQMSWVFKRPWLTLFEVGWRWLVGIPLLLICWEQWQRILASYPLASSGFDSINSQNPWVAAVQITDVWSYYTPHVLAVLRWLAPVAALGWMIASGVGRNVLLKRMEPGTPFRPVGIVLLQAAWLGLLAATCWGWLRSVQWVAATHISNSGDPNLVGYFSWVIFLSLGFFSAWALMNWILAITPLLLLFERRSAFSALAESLRLGKTFSSKLVETNLVMGIVTLMLVVLTMVFSAAPLPFAAEVGSGAMHFAVAVSSLFYVLASDYFQVVRLKGYVEFWKLFREGNSVRVAAR